MCVVEVQIADQAGAYAPFEAETSVHVAFVSGSQHGHASDAQSAALFDVTEFRDAENAIHAVKAGHADKVAQNPLGSPNRPVRP